MRLLNRDPVGTGTTLISTSVSLATMNGYVNETIDRDVRDVSMIVESMSLDDLYQLKDLVDEKGNSYKLHI